MSVEGEHAVRRTREADLEIITLARADVRNALTPDMLRTVRAFATDAGRAGARALLLSGEGRCFCAGFDLDLCREDPGGSAMRALLDGLSDAILTLRTLEIPVVVCAHGAAIAGGAALLGGADVVVADEAAKIGYPVVRLGISPAVSAPFLRAGVGGGACRSRLLDSGLISGARAHELGLAHYLEPDAESARTTARHVARLLSEKPPHAMAATKRWLNDLDGTGSRNVARRALAVSRELTGGDEERERLTRFWAARDEGNAGR